MTPEKIIANIENYTIINEMVVFENDKGIGLLCPRRRH